MLALLFYLKGGNFRLDGFMVILSLVVESMARQHFHVVGTSILNVFSTPVNEPIFGEF